MSWSNNLERFSLVQIVANKSIWVGYGTASAGEDGSTLAEPTVGGYARTSLGAYTTGRYVLTVSVGSTGGSNYVVGDELYPTGGTYGVSIVITVTSVDGGGAVTGVEITNKGAGTVNPSGTDCATTTDSTLGSGCVLDLTFGDQPGEVTNDAAVECPEITATQGTITHIYFFDASTGSGSPDSTYIGESSLAALGLPNINGNVGVQVTFDAGKCKLTLD